MTFGYLNYFLQLVHLPVFDLSQGIYSAPIGILVISNLKNSICNSYIICRDFSIDASIFDAGAIDGVSWWKRMYLLTLPIIKPIIVVAFAFRFMDALKMFDEIYVITVVGQVYY